MYPKKGDKVFYAGSDPKIHQDYGGQELVIVQISRTSGRVVCETLDGRALVGVNLWELQSFTPQPKNHIVLKGSIAISKGLAEK